MGMNRLFLNDECRVTRVEGSTDVDFLFRFRFWLFVIVMCGRSLLFHLLWVFTPFKLALSDGLSMRSPTGVMKLGECMVLP